MNERPIIEEIAELRAMAVGPLIERYEELHGRPPRSKNRDWLWRRCAWRLQEARLGGLSVAARARVDALVAEIDFPFTPRQTIRGAVSSGGPQDPRVGATVFREWRGRDIRAMKTMAGWQHEGVTYRSLSAVVKAITGSHTSGPAWFGLKPPTRRGDG